MALIQCPSCGKDISNKAEKCPNCNTVISQSKKKENNKYCLYGFISGVISLFFYFIFAIAPIAAIILSSVGLSKYDNQKHKNKWMGYIGLTLGIIYTVQFFVRAALFTSYG